MKRIDWTTRLEIPVRLITLPLDGAVLDDQAQSIQSTSPEFLETSIGALSMLAQIAGRRIPPSMRAAIPDAIIEILQGQLDTGFGETQDLLAPTLGELFGSLFFVLESGSDADIIRVIESVRQRNPDYLVVQPSQGGLALSIVECKGTTTDLHVAQQRGQLDICSRMWQRRREGIKQLNMPDSSQLGNRLYFHSIEPGRSPLAESVRAVSVTCAPDGRLLNYRMNVRAPDRRTCQSTTCVECSRARTGEANLIVTLNKQRLASDEPIDSSLVSLLQSYRSCEQAVWSGNERHLSEAYRDLLQQAAKLEHTDISRLSDFLLAPLARAVVLGLPVELVDVPLTEFPDSFQREICLFQQELESADDRDAIGLDDLVNLSSQWLERREWVKLREKNRFEDRWEDTEFKGIIRDMGEGVLDIRVCPSNAELGSTYESSQVAQNMQNMVERIIHDLHPTWHVYWERAAVRFQGNQYVIGEYWNRFPYPHEGKSLPGFTTWVGWDGRARIICRFPKRRSARTEWPVL